MSARLISILILSAIGIIVAGLVIGYVLMEIGAGWAVLLIMAIALIVRSPGALIGAFMAARHSYWRW